MTALQHLNALANQRKAERSPTSPAACIRCFGCDDQDANGITCCIVDYLKLSGHFVIQLANTGTCHTDVSKLTSSQQRAGLPDVFAMVEGRAVFVEVKTLKDRLSNGRKHTILTLKKAGALIYVAHNFEGFYNWYQRTILTLTALPDTPDIPPHPIPWLATPDLLPLPIANQQES